MATDVTTDKDGRLRRDAFPDLGAYELGSLTHAYLPVIVKGARRGLKRPNPQQGSWREAKR